MPIEIILPAGTERVTVREIPELFATAIFPEVPRGTPRQVVDVKKMPLTEHNKLHWCGRGVQPFPVRLTAEDIAELWPSLPKLRLPIDEDKWQPYADAFARSNIIDWDLRVITEDPELVRIIVSEVTKEKRWQGIKDAVRNGELIPRSPITHMPEPDAIGEALKDCFVFVENLREYAARDGIIVSVRSGDNQTYADPSGATEKAAPEVTPADDEQGEAATPPTTQNAQPIPRQRFQESEILRVISELGHHAQAIPKWKAGKAGVKAEVRAILTVFSDKVFELAWDRLRRDKRIRDAE